MSADTDLIRTFYSDQRRLLDSLAADVEWHESEGMHYGGVYRGPAAVVKHVFDPLRAEWRDFAANPHTILDAGDGNVVTLGHYSGVNRATGKSMRAAFAHVYRVEGGKVVRFDQYADSARFNAAMS